MDNITSSAIPPITIQVCYAEANHQFLIDMTVTKGTRLIEAIRQSGIEKKLSIAIKEGNVGIFGQKKPIRRPASVHTAERNIDGARIV